MTSDSDQESQPSPLKDDLSRQLRSASPAIKRPASDMGAQEREEHNTDVEMGDSKSSFTPINPEAQSNTDLKAKQQDTGVRHGDRDGSSSQIPSINLPDGDASLDGTSTSLSEPLQTPSVRSTAATSIASDIPPSVDPPSIDEQVGTVITYIQKEPKDKQKGFVVSQKWLTRVHARSSDPPKGTDKNATEGDIGPVDNSDVVLVTDYSGKLLDVAGEKFVALKPGLRLGEEYQILPQEAWDLIVSWYGLSKESPVIIRYAYDISQPDHFQRDVQYELNPPIFSLLKIPAGDSPKTQREANDPPVQIVTSKYISANEWLKKSKQALNIDMSTKVRVWRILGGLKSTSAAGILTPAASRSASPAPGTEIVASAGDKMLLDINTFAALALGEHREKVDMEDQTNNTKFNGKSTLDTFSLGGRNDVLAFEEQKAGTSGDWPSDHARYAQPKNVRDKFKGLTGSGRTSPAPGMTTRGRSRQNGRPRGIIGLSNLGNTCYMNSALQSLRSVEELTQYFLHEKWKDDLNPNNPLGFRGEIAKAYASLIKQIYEETGSSTWPGNFKKTIGKHGAQFTGYLQQDSQEFLLFLLDGLQEDLNRIQKKPYIEKPDSTDEMVHNYQALKDFADRNWEIYKARNDSVITDLFAGMYKSTLTCPVCDKVSIIFDPFSNLTLQLPIENNWSKELLYIPYGKRAIRLDVEIDKNASISALKEFVATRTGASVDKLVVAEDYKNKFYKIFDNPITISEANIQTNDIICCFELDEIPTNYNPNKRQKVQTYSTFPKATEDDEVDPDGPGADRLMVPLFHRLVKNPTGRVASKPFFSIPTYIVIDRQQSMTYQGVLRRILSVVASMTTQSLFQDDDFVRDLSPENSDTVVMTDDGSGSGPNAASEAGEDGYVDVKMQDSDAKQEAKELPTTTAQRYLQSGRPLPARLTKLFEICVASTGESIPLGWNSISENSDFPSIRSRVPRSMPHRPRKDDSDASTENNSGSESSEGDLPDVEYEEITAESAESVAESESSEPIPSMEEAPDHNMSKSRGRNKQNKGKKTYKDKNRSHLGKQKQQPRPIIAKQPTPTVDGPGLVKPGEAIILDWTVEGHDALFGGSESDEDEMRGAPTWKSVPALPDEALAARRKEKNRRRQNGVSLEDCLNEFGKSETLSEQNAWYCPRCKEHRRADKKFELWKAPDILVMHLKRFSSNRNFRDKLDIKVDYPIEGLDLTKMVQDTEGKSMIYDLVAVDNHYGGLGGGHYTAYGKHFGNGNWYEYNGK